MSDSCAREQQGTTAQQDFAPFQEIQGKELQYVQKAQKHELSARCLWDNKVRAMRDLHLMLRVT